MPKRRKAPPGTYWRGEVLWGRIRLTGKPAYQWSLGTDDPKIAARRYAEQRAELLGRVKFGEARPTFEEVVAAWCTWFRAIRSPKTVTRYLCSLGQLAPCLDGKFIDEVDSKLVADIVDARTGQGVTVATVKRDLVALSSVIGFAIDKAWVETNPVLPRLGRLKERRNPISLPEHAHIEIVARRAPGRLQDLIRAALLTGCRQEELASATVSQFDEARGQLTVIGKRNKRRTLDLSPAAVAAIRPTKADKHYLFTSGKGDRFHGVATRFYDLVRGDYGIPTGPNNDGVKPFKFHHLRHRYAVDYLKAGGSIYDLQKLLGHSSVKTTEIYLEFLTPTEERAAKFGT